MQSIEEEALGELNGLADRFNGLSARLEQITVSPAMSEKPLADLAKYNSDAHRAIDQVTAMKREELHELLEEYQALFKAKNNEERVKINASKRRLAEMMINADISREQLNNLEKSMGGIELYLESLKSHSIDVSATLPLFFVGFRRQFFDCPSHRNDERRMFDITHIRLDGSINKYHVMIKESGTMRTLTESFIQKYALLDQLTQMELGSNCDSDHQPKVDFILAVEVHEHRIRLQYTDETKLNAISLDDTIAFYETPHSLKTDNSPQILLPCLFERLPQKEAFGFPIYLSVPRQRCTGQDVLDALKSSLGQFFPLDADTDQHLYTAMLEFRSLHANQTKQVALEESLQHLISFDKTPTILTVSVDNQLAQIYPKNKTAYGRFQ